MQNEEEESWTYEDIFNAVMEDQSITMTIESTSLEAIKKGVINYKQAARKRALYNKIPWEPITLIFRTAECANPEERKFYVDLTIEIARKATVSIKRMSITPKICDLEDN